MTFLTFWLTGFIITFCWGAVKFGPLSSWYWWAPYLIFLTWPIGLISLIMDA